MKKYDVNVDFSGRRQFNYFYRFYARKYLLMLPLPYMREYRCEISFILWRPTNKSYVLKEIHPKSKFLIEKYTTFLKKSDTSSQYSGKILLHSLILNFPGEWKKCPYLSWRHDILFLNKSNTSQYSRKTFFSWHLICRRMEMFIYSAQDNNTWCHRDHDAR